MRELWLPARNMQLPEYQVPPQVELNNIWQQYSGGVVVDAPGVYGSIRVPERGPRVFASIDLCEVIRETSRAVRSVELPEGPESDCVHCYAEGLSIADDIMPVVQTLMNGDVVPPIDNIGDIANILRSWRRAGVYVSANTSTLPGCEEPTIRFLERYLSGCFDGLLLPRNHDGTLPLTKGIAAQQLVRALATEEQPIAAIHIDDLSHHNQGFREAIGQLPGATVATFQPTYASCHKPDAGSYQVPTPFAAFQAANAFLAECR